MYQIIEDIVQGPNRQKRRVWILIDAGLDEMDVREIMANALLDLRAGFDEIEISAYEERAAIKFNGWVARLTGSPSMLTFENLPELRRDLWEAYGT